MFYNVGGKIKKLAEVCFFISVLIWCVVGIYTMWLTASFEGVFTGLLIMGAGAFLSWVGSSVMYGFGQLIENTDIIRRYALEEEDELCPAEEDDE